MAFSWTKSITGSITADSINELKTCIDSVDTNKNICSTNNTNYNASLNSAVYPADKVGNYVGYNSSN